ncbi:MAG: DnaA/Hda family protein, partial [Planctomycetota bacterium]
GDASRVNVATASGFQQGLIRRQFHAELCESAIEVLGERASVAYGVRDGVSANAKPQRASRPQNLVTESTPPEPPAAAVADALAGWVVGESNAPASRLAERLIAGEVVASPILLWGPSGVGKTQLLRLIASCIRNRRRKARVLAITAEQFLRGFVEAARGGGYPAFRQKHEGADVFLIDDVQQLVGKARTVEEFRQIIDNAIEAGAQIVLTADRGPNELRDLGPEIASRLAGGLAVEMAMPDAAMREQLVNSAAKRISLDLPEKTAKTLACRLIGGARETSGAVNRMSLLHDTFASPLDERLAQQVADDTNRLSTPPVRLADIQKAVCGVCGIDSRLLRSDKRTKAVTEPRMLAMWLARKMTGSAWSEIGDFFGRKSHSTVISAHRRVEKLLASPEPTRLVSGELGETIRRVEAALRTA